LINEKMPMKKISSNIKHLFIRRERGAILILTLIFMLLGFLIIYPLLAYMGTGIKTSVVFNKLKNYIRLMPVLKMPGGKLSMINLPVSSAHILLPSIRMILIQPGLMACRKQTDNPNSIIKMSMFKSIMCGSLKVLASLIKLPLNPLLIT